MLTNIQYGKDYITIDYRLKQMRYLKNIADHGPIYFMDLSNGDVQGYGYLIKNNVPLFKTALKDDLRDRLNMRIDTKKLRIKNDSTSLQ